MKRLFNYEKQLEINKSSDIYEIENLFYSIMYRRWQNAYEEVEKLDQKWNELRSQKFRDTEITIEMCFKKNLQFLKSNKNKVVYEKLSKYLGNDFINLPSDKNTSYDTEDFYENKSVFDIFFEGNQPILDVKYFKKQTLAAEQMMENKATMVLDEVGTGKTVAGIYAIQQIIQNRIDEKTKDSIFPSAAILIICPYNKREDWNSDIRRQLARESIMVHKNDNGKVIKQKAYNKNKPLIYIMGCKGGENDGSDVELKKSLKTFKNNRNWDLVIIDECHNCFDNYKDILADRVMLLTATPIISKNGSVRDFQKYKELMNKILGSKGYSDCKISNHIKIDPINVNNPTINDIFVCHYKEDIFNVNINRKIQFIPCARTPKRQEWFRKLRYEKDFFTAMYADQDDNRLSEKMSECFTNSLEDYSIEKNYKLEKLEAIVSGRGGFDKYINKSMIIFCEMQATVDMIYDKLAVLADKTTMIGKKYGEIGEIRNVTSNSGIVLEKLKTHIRANIGNRSILITTGKSGGTGLNFGEFNIVIHYELPYTNNELEQRFGRIERADDLITTSSNSSVPVIVENEMIFLINEAVNNQSDFETNRMLYYAINKINIACNYMPIRNTVLFYPDFIERVKNDAKKCFERIKKYCEYQPEDIENYIAYKKEEESVKKHILTIEKELSDQDVNKIQLATTLEEKIAVIFNNIACTQSIETCKGELNKFLKSDNSKNREIDDWLEQVLEYFIWLEKTCRLWGMELIFKDNNMHNLSYDEVFEKDNVEGEEVHKIIETNNKENSAELFNSVASIKKQIIEQKLDLRNMVDSILETLQNPNNIQNTTGVFYCYNNEFRNESVHQYRSRGNE